MSVIAWDGNIFLMRPEKGITVDHKDHNGLNNQRYNMRYATRKQQQQNALPKQGCRSQYKDVTYASSMKRKKRWRAYIEVEGKKRFLGMFEKEIDAAKAYNDAAIKHFGEFACISPL